MAQYKINSRHVQNENCVPSGVITVRGRRCRRLRVCLCIYGECDFTSPVKRSTVRGVLEGSVTKRNETSNRRRVEASTGIGSKV